MINIIIGFISGTLSSMGLGGGTILLIYLTVFKNLNHNTAAGINLLYFLPCSLISSILYFKNKIIAGRDILIISSGAILGAIIGAYFSGIVNNAILQKIFAVFILIIGLKQLFKS